MNSFPTRLAVSFLVLSAGALTPPASALHFVRVAVSDGHSCAITAAGNLYCWGANSAHQVGAAGDTEAVDEPRLVAGNHRFRDVAPGDAFTCAIDTAGAAYCWGEAGKGQLGGGKLVDRRAVPTAVAGGHHFTSIAAAGVDVCALDDTGHAWCWGRPEPPAANGTAPPAMVVPTAIAGDLTFTRIAAANYTTCAIVRDGRLYCWGTNGKGTVGDGSRTSRPAPVLVPGVDHVTDVAVAIDHVCAATAAGEVRCWGSNVFGQLGTGASSNDPVLTPQAVVSAGARLVSLTASIGITCALDASGVAYCWGAGQNKWLGSDRCSYEGQPAEPCATKPTAVETPVRFTQLAASSMHVCGVSREGAVYCWGVGGDGRLGTGDEIDQLRPTAVAAPR